MKKILFLLLFLSIYYNNLYAQGTGGFFNQQSSKQKLMLAQIAEYETFLKELKSGYSTTENGLNTIDGLKTGTFTLHQNYYNSLKQVTPAVANDPKVKGISDLLTEIEQTFDQAISWQKDKVALTGSEISYIQSVYSNLLTECNKELDQLKLAITSGAVQMTDQQRIHNIDLVYADMQQKYRFTCAFTAQANDLANGRMGEKSGNQTLKQWYNIN